MTFYADPNLILGLGKQFRDIKRIDTEAADRLAQRELDEIKLAYDISRNKQADLRSANQENREQTKFQSEQAVRDKQIADMQRQEAELNKEAYVTDFTGNNPRAAMMLFGSKAHGREGDNMDALLDTLGARFEELSEEEAGQKGVRFIDKSTGKYLTKRDIYSKQNEIKALVLANTAPEKIIQTKMDELVWARQTNKINDKQFAASKASLDKATSAEKMRLAYEAKQTRLMEYAKILPKSDYEAAMKDTEDKIKEYTDIARKEANEIADNIRQEQRNRDLINAVREKASTVQSPEDKLEIKFIEKEISGLYDERKELVSSLSEAETPEATIKIKALIADVDNRIKSLRNSVLGKGSVGGETKGVPSAKDTALEMHNTGINPTDFFSGKGKSVPKSLQNEITAEYKKLSGKKAKPAEVKTIPQSGVAPAKKSIPANTDRDPVVETYNAIKNAFNNLPAIKAKREFEEKERKREERGF